MTDIRIIRQAGFIKGFRISGHAGYADSGYDIVCAAVSAISQTAAMGIVEVLKIKAALKQDDEQGTLTLDLPDVGDERAEAVLQTMAHGLQSIQQQYPNFLRITFFETEVTSI